MKEFPIIESNEIILRELELTDNDNYYDYVTDEKISSQFNFNHTEESAKNRLEELVNRYSMDNKPLVWAISKKSNNELIGIISIDNISFTNKNFSLACGIRKIHRGNHFAYQATQALIDYIFNNYDMHRVELAHNTDNIASQKTIEKLGAKYEGIARESKYYKGAFKDRKIYSILKDEWIKGNNSVKNENNN